MNHTDLHRLIDLDHAHVWHPFTPMQQWRETEPMFIESAQGDYLIDAAGNRYIDGISSLWCNVHGHRVPQLDEAVRKQLDKVAHTTMLGLCNIPATELAARLCDLAPGELNKVFYTDSGATATEVAFKMAIGYWFHCGQKQRDTFIAIEGAYHGDTTGSMSVGYSATFHKPFDPMVFQTLHVDSPDVFHYDGTGLEVGKKNKKGQVSRVWSLEDEQACDYVRDRALRSLETVLKEQGERIAAVVVEPVVQGAAGMIMQPTGYLKGVEQLCLKYDTLLIADEVAVGFGRTGKMFACEHESVEPDILCLGKGITGGYLPLAATLATDEIEQAFCGDLGEHKTLYHGHTYTGNPLAAAVANASLDLFEENDLLNQVNQKAAMVARMLDVLRDATQFPNVGDVRQRGLMVGIELVPPSGEAGRGFDPSRRLGYEVTDACRSKGLIIRPLGNVVTMVPPPGIAEETLRTMTEIIIGTIRDKC